MMTKRLMASGRWDLQLLPGTPRSVRRQLEISTATGHGFNSIVVTPGHYRLEDVSGTDVFSEAEYVGVHRQTEGLTVSGPGVEFWAGDEHGKFDGSAGTLGSATQTFTDWVTAITSNGLQLAAGSIEAIAGNVTWDPPYPMTPRDMLDYICLQKGAEWRINNARTVDAGTIAHLYSTTPIAVVSPQARGGPEPGGYRGVVGRVRLSTSVEDWAGMIEYSGNSGAGGYPRSSLPYYGPGGTQFVQGLYVLDNSTTSADATVRATARVVYGDDTLKRTYTVEGLGTRKPMTDIGTPGMYLYVFDPAELIIDTANQIHFQGQACWPMKLRIIAVSWPFRRGQGVYYRYWDGAAMATIDITDHVDWEAEERSNAKVEVGHPSMSWTTPLRARYEEWTVGRR
jgi:hypothetical protein